MKYVTSIDRGLALLLELLSGMPSLNSKSHDEQLLILEIDMQHLIGGRMKHGKNVAFTLPSVAIL